MLDGMTREKLNLLLARQFLRTEPGLTCSRYSLMWDSVCSEDARTWAKDAISALRDESVLAEVDRYPGWREAEQEGFIVEAFVNAWGGPNGLFRKYRRIGIDEATLPPSSIRLSTGGLSWESWADVEILWEHGHARYDINLGHGKRGISASRDLDRTEVEILLHALRDSVALTWEAHYKNPGVLDGEHWELLVRYSNGCAFKSEGSNNWPEGFDILHGAFYDLGMMRCGDRRRIIDSL